MNEPSVLDYLKSIFKSWDKFTNFLRTFFVQQDTTQLEEFRAEAVEAVQIEEPAVSEEPADASVAYKFPRIIFGVLFFALVGQLMFEPPQTTYMLGIFLYIAALGLAILSLRIGRWYIAPLPAGEMRTDSFSIRNLPFILSLIFGALTFYFMKDNLFTKFNVALWILTVFFHIRAFWIREPWQFNFMDKVKDAFSGGELKITFTLRGLLLLAIFGMGVYFGFHQLNTLPRDMTSDHAEKLLDVWDITQGTYHIFFERNTGREPLQFYLTAFLSNWFGVSFLSLKISTALMGLISLTYIYFLGRELGGERVAVLAAAFAAMGVWAVMIDRIGLRFAYYPPFTAATLYYFIRGLRRQHRNDFVLAGIALGIGLNGYTPMRIVPFVLIALFIIYFLHQKDAQARRQALVWFGLLAFTAWIFIIPLSRFALERPDLFGERAFSRLGTVERDIPGSPLLIFINNVWVGLKVFNWYSGNVWTFTLPSRAALDVVSAALFSIGIVLVIFRYIRYRKWQDVMLLIAVPMLQLPSTLSIAFPEENPILNRMSATFVPVFILVAIGLDGIMRSFSGESNAENEKHGNKNFLFRTIFPTVLALVLFFMALTRNYNMYFHQYAQQYDLTSWNTREMGTVMKNFIDKGGSPDQAWIVPYPFWVDTRLPLFWAGPVYRQESAIPADRIPETLQLSGAKLFMFHMEDVATKELLKSLYPDGVLTVFISRELSKNFYVYRVDAP